MNRTMMVVAVAFAASGVRFAAQDWDRADREVTRLLPSAFTQLPRSIRDDLEARGCTIPQAFSARGPENVIRGRFTSSAHFDWAVLCSRQRVSAILVYRNGSTQTIDELEPAADKSYLQGIGDGVIGFSRTISRARPVHIREHADGIALPPLEHDGIESHFVEKASAIWYWVNSSWRQLPGAD